MAQQFANGAATTLSSPALSTDTVLNVVATTNFPTLGAGDWVYLTLATPTTPETAREIVKVTSWTGTAVTCVRGQDGTTAQAWAAASRAELRPVAQMLRDMINSSAVALAALQAELASTTAGQGDALVGVMSSLTGGVARTQHQKNSDVLCAADFGVLPANADNTSAWAVAVAAAVSGGKTLWVPNGTYVGTLAVTSSNFELVGESRQKCILKAKDNSTPVITVSGGAQWVMLRNFTVAPATAGNNGTQWGIYANSAPYLYLDKVTVYGFNNNIHVMSNNEITLQDVVSSGAVIASTVAATYNSISYNIPTGCALYVNGMGGGGALVVIRDSHFWTSSYGVFTDTCQAPMLVNTESLLCTNTGFYFTVYNGATGTSGIYATGPFLSNIQSDSSTICGIYLQQQINASGSGCWSSPLVGGTAILLSNSSFNSFHGTQVYGNSGPSATGVHLSSGSHHNTFTGGTIQGTSGAGILVDPGCPNNLFVGMAINGCTPTYQLLDTTASGPNSIIACSTQAAGGSNVSQSKDFLALTSQLNGMMTALQFGQSSMAANSSGNMTPAGAGGLATFVMPSSGSIVAISSNISGAGITAGTAQFTPLIAGSNSLTSSMALQNNPGSTATAAFLNLQSKGVHFTAGQTVGVQWLTIAGTIPGLNASVTLWIVLD